MIGWFRSGYHHHWFPLQKLEYQCWHLWPQDRPRGQPITTSNRNTFTQLYNPYRSSIGNPFKKVNNILIEKPYAAGWHCLTYWFPFRSSVHPRIRPQFIFGFPKTAFRRLLQYWFLALFDRSSDVADQIATKKTPRAVLFGIAAVGIEIEWGSCWPQTADRRFRWDDRSAHLRPWVLVAVRTVHHAPDHQSWPWADTPINHSAGHPDDNWLQALSK